MKNGFTLVELLAVVVLLSILAGIVFYSVNKIVVSSKKSLTDNQIETIEKAAQTYYLKEGINNNKNNACVTLDFLIENGYIENDKIENFAKNKKMNGHVQITYKANQYRYEYNEGKCINQKIICTYDISSSVAEKTAGAKYSCEVKPGTSYNFYVLTTPAEGDTTINLIMDRNICEDGTPVTESNTCFVAYNSSGDASGVGPVTAMTYLNNATSTWKNIDNLNLTYDDEGNHFEDFVLNGKARLPYYSEVSAYDSTNKTNAYLYDYLNQSGTIQTNAISGIYGYWTLSSYADYSDFAWRVESSGRVSHDYVYYTSDPDSADDCGVRPVITISKDYIE